MDLHAAVSGSVTCSELSFLFVDDSVGSCRRMLRCHNDLLNQNDDEPVCVVRKLPKTTLVINLFVNYHTGLMCLM